MIDPFLVLSVVIAMTMVIGLCFGAMYLFLMIVSLPLRMFLRM